MLLSVWLAFQTVDISGAIRLGEYAMATRSCSCEGIGRKNNFYANCSKSMAQKTSFKKNIKL